MKIINKIILGDCLDVLPQIDDNVFDLVIIDPPFLIAKYNALRVHMRKSFGDLGLIEFFFKNVFKQLERVLKNTAYFYVFCNATSYPLFWFYTFPFTKYVRILVWNKGTSINGFSWRHQHDLILFASMPDTKKVLTGDGDIINAKSISVKKRIHPAQKPEELIKKLILKNSKEGDLVADFFVGSGTVLKVAKDLKRNYFGIEYDKSYYDMTKKRLENTHAYKNIENYLEIIEKTLKNEAR